MASSDAIRVAAVQATPVILDANATVEKAVALLAEAAAEGARLAVLPEAFISLYPSNAWARGATAFSGWDELWERMWESAVDVRGTHVLRLVDACRDHHVHCVVGVNERDDDRPGTLYNTMLVLGPGGVLHRHRKLMPTMQERVFHGVGAGDDLGVTELPGIGRVGGLICWENRMPLARYALYREGPQVWAAPTADDSDGWLASMRHIAIESGAFVISVPQYIPASAFGADFPVPLPEGKAVFGEGGAAIIEPTWGNVIAGPLRGREGILYADCDLRASLRAKRWFDVVGHYAREDVLCPALGLAPAPGTEPAGADGATGPRA
jgi:nitrilase